MIPSPSPETVARRNMIADQLFHSGKPHFEVTIRLSRSVVNKGLIRFEKDRSVQLGIRIFGYGGITSGKLVVDLPQGVIDETNPGRVWTTVHSERTPDGMTSAVVAKDPDHRLDKFGTTIGFATAIFMPTSVQDTPFICPQIAGETANQYGWPINLQMNIARDALEGDHPINAVMTYNDGLDWQAATYTASLHVNSWYEKWRWLLDPLGIALALVAGVAALRAMIP